MSVQNIQTTQPAKNAYVKTAAVSAAGALAGAGSRYILPTKKELSSIVNKDAVDTFVSSASATARANGRSILKYGAVGALIASAVAMISNILHKKEEIETNTYSKLGALLDAPDYAVEIMWYKDQD